MKLIKHQELPTNFVEREKIRDKGQFWTPPWIADAMVSYLLLNKECNEIFDPAVGAGIFLITAKKIAEKEKRNFSLVGIDIDKEVINLAKENGLSGEESKNIFIRDFITNPPKKKFSGIVANPPYIRHHRLSQETKVKLKSLSKEIIGQTIDGRAGIHIYFLIQALNLLEKNGHLAFILPADTCEGNFSNNPCTPNPNCGSTFTVTVPLSVAAGAYSLTVTGNPGGKTIPVTLTVVDPPLTVASCSASPAAPNINDNVTWSASVSGGSGSYGYSWSAPTGF